MLAFYVLLKIESSGFTTNHCYMVFFKFLAITHKQIPKFDFIRKSIKGLEEMLPTAILRRIHPIPSELGSQAAKGPVSTGVGDRPGSP